MTRLIALDIDGVLNRHETYQERYWPPIDPVLVGRLDRLVRETDARVVISSTWRLMYTLTELRELLARAGGLIVAGRVIGRTPELRYPDDMPRPRGEEIEAWLAGWRERARARLVILDDADDMAHLLPRLVRTDPFHGLTDADCERVVALFEEAS